ncbi:cation-translocating P-type ATPase [Sulfurihydrogenibium subterraneum]|uniref:cation-translocating P-type ATPase n=1 Tax=Sulfurihydrogenibium subterraneum TaxID=171121 RepID=UPI00048C482B|nr:cation-transporting P-type ATPase [Sulfurihydrogenibium subterraneum]
MHNKSVEEVLKELKSSINGLSTEEAEKRLKIYGKNRIELEEESLLKIFIRQFTNPLILILIVASFIALYMGDLKDFYFIVGIVFINGMIGFYQEYKAKSKIKDLLQLSVPKVEVLRDGKTVELSSEDITVGDIVILREGDVIPADVRFIETNNILVDESLLTGESIPVEKHAEKILPLDTPIYERENIGFGGTYVVKGIGKAVVFAVGLNTEMGRIYSKLKVKERETPLTRAIGNFSKKLIITLIIILSFILVIGLLQGKDLKNLIMLVIAQLVSSVPEGLPIVITIALVIGAITLYKKKVLIRQLPAVESLGSATFICTDKTGTITENKLKVEEIYSLDKDIVPLIFTLCNDSEIERGDPIEIAMLRWLEDNGYDYIDIREKHPRIWLYPFDTKLKLMASIHKVENKNILFIKGAFESLEKLAINKEDVEKLKSKYDQMAESGLRVLAFGYQILDHSIDDINKARINLIGLIGFLDPPKQTAVDAVKAAKQAGIKVIMITGDSLKTAISVAKMVGIHEEGKLTLEGKDLEKYTDEELKNLLYNISVVARSTPEDKYRIVRILQSSGEQVVMMGDGVNDMPAVKAADLGVAMNEGSQATKSVAKMILLERDLSVTVDAIKIGRRISHNLRKTIHYLLSTNIGEILILFFAFILALPQPLYATQILWINLVTDGIQDKPLVLTKEEVWIFKLNPKTFSIWFIDKIQIFRVLYFSTLMGLIIIGIFYYLLKTTFLDVAITLTFLNSIFFQWANGLQSVRELPFFYNVLENFKANPYIFIVTTFIGLPIQVAIIYFFPDFLHCVPISFKDWMYPFLVFVIAFFLIEIRKWFEFLLFKKVYNI